MFKSLKLNSRYSSDKNNIVDEFFNPILRIAKKYDRTSAYFSSKALALYSQGLEFFAKKGNKFRLIISQEISQDDYELIKKGYFLRTQIKDKMLSSLDEKISLSEEKNLSNLAYLISIGIIDIKFAFVKEGIFHEKCGIFYDEEGNVITFNGSLNETEAAISRNYESFHVYPSWIDNNNFYKNSITDSIEHFEELWSKKNNEIIVIDAEEIILNKIGQFNKNRIIIDTIYLKNNSVILDVDNENKVFIYLNYDNWQNFMNYPFFKINIKFRVDFYKNNYIYLKDLSINNYKKISNLLNANLLNHGINYFESQRFKNYIERKNLHINSRIKVGTSIKNKEESIKEKFLLYENNLKKLMLRQLRHQQAWDSFFMYAMKKSCNFSVPGSGKTASVLGTFAYLNASKEVNKIVVIGPKNCFESWIDEFIVCFGKEKLKCFDIQSDLSSENKRLILEHRNDFYNLILINYESLKAYGSVIKKIIKGNELLVFDEIHRIKKIDGVYSKVAINIAKNANYTVALTGTPIPNSYKDIYNTLNVLFGAEYQDFFGFTESALANPSEFEINSINQKIFPFFCRTTKKNLDVPQPNEDYIETLYSNKNENELFKLIYFKYRKSNFELFVRLLQLESNPEMLLEKIDLDDFKDMYNDWEEEIEKEFEFEDNSEKIKSLVASINQTTKWASCLSLIKKIIEQNKQVIIWCIFKKTMKKLQKDLSNLNISSEIICGETNLYQRKIILEDFKNKNFKILITNPHTLAESISLHKICHDAIYFEYSYNLVHLLQSKDRIHRLGLDSNQYTQWYFFNVFYKVNEISFSMSEKIYKRLKEKEERMIKAIENNYLESMTPDEEDLNIIFKDLKKIT